MARADASIAYHMSGGFLELCDCYAVCPCWLDLLPDEGRCTGVFGWAIAEGEIDGVDVGGRRVVSVSFHSGHRNTGGQEVYLFIDEDASDDQFERLAYVFTGKAGGPLDELGTLLGILRATERAAIDLSTKGRHASMTVDHRISGDARMLVGADDEITELSHGRLAIVLAPTAQVGTSSTFRVELGGAFTHPIEVHGRSAMRGQFRYRHDGGRA
jgi:hypothetical protein